MRLLLIGAPGSGQGTQAELPATPFRIPPISHRHLLPPPAATGAVIQNRLQVYLDRTVPLLRYYAGREWMFTVNGAQPPEAVHEDIVERLAKLDGLAARPREQRALGLPEAEPPAQYPGSG